MKQIICPYCTEHVYWINKETLKLSLYWRQCSSCGKPFLIEKGLSNNFICHTIEKIQNVEVRENIKAICDNAISKINYIGYKP